MLGLKFFFFYLIDEPKDQLYGEIQILREWKILEMVFSNITEGIFSYTVIGRKKTVCLDSENCIHNIQKIMDWRQGVPGKRVESHVKW